MTKLTQPSHDRHWIHRAEGPRPLERNLDAAAFEERYGTPPELAFRPYGWKSLDAPFFGFVDRELKLPEDRKASILPAF